MHDIYAAQRQVRISKGDDGDERKRIFHQSQNGIKADEKPWLEGKTTQE